MAYGLWRVPGGTGILHAAAGLVVYALVGYGWIVALFFSPRVLDPMVAPLRGVHLEGVGVLLVYFAPPLLAALVTVRVLGRDRMSR